MQDTSVALAGQGRRVQTQGTTSQNADFLRRWFLLPHCISRVHDTTTEILWLRSKSGNAHRSIQPPALATMINLSFFRPATSSPRLALSLPNFLVPKTPTQGVQQVRFRGQLAPRRTKYRKAAKGAPGVRIRFWICLEDSMKLIFCWCRLKYLLFVLLKRHWKVTNQSSSILLHDFYIRILHVIGGFFKRNSSSSRHIRSSRVLFRPNFCCSVNLMSSGCPTKDQTHQGRSILSSCLSRYSRMCQG